MQEQANTHEQVICANVFIRDPDTGRYLVLRRSPQKRYAPNVINPVGGKVETDENPYAAAIREAAEETGLAIANLRLEALILELQPEKNEPYNWLIFQFSADWVGGEVQSTDEGELLWMSAEELKKQDLFPSVSLTIDHILDRSKGTVFATIEYDAEKRNVVRSTVELCVVG